jgi:AcrR family transcriptional regulator
VEEPPYRRIVADIRRRISSGELRPGDLVPSTRQIAIRWGVAPATATKVLVTLRQEGLVHSSPRVGTIVATSVPGVPETAPDAAGEHELSQDRIVRVAIQLADSEGLDALSMRAIAARLGASTMSIYRYVASKDDLVLLMADAAFGEAPPATRPAGGWRGPVTEAVRTLWTLHRRHPWLAHLSPLSRPLPLPRLLAHGERILAALAGAGLEPVRAFDVEILLYSYVQGLAANIEREAHAQATTGLSDEEWLHRQGPAMGAIVTSGEYPAYASLFSSFGTAGYDLDLDRLFDQGLALLLDGLAPLVDGKTGRDARNPPTRA